MIIVVVFLRPQRLEHSRVGRAWLAIREDEDAAELMGVPTFRFKLWAFAIGAGDRRPGRHAVRRPQGIHQARQTSTLMLSILFLAAVVLGGSGNMPGVILGAVHRGVPARAVPRTSAE